MSLRRVSKERNLSGSDVTLISVSVRNMESKISTCKNIINIFISKHKTYFYRHDYKLLFDTDVQKVMSKADRLIYGESAMTHAMTFTAFSRDPVRRFNIYLFPIFIIRLFYYYRRRLIFRSSALRILGEMIVARKVTS